MDLRFFTALSSTQNFLVTSSLFLNKLYSKKNVFLLLDISMPTFALPSDSNFIKLVNFSPLILFELEKKFSDSIKFVFPEPFGPITTIFLLFLKFSLKFE